MDKKKNKNVAILFSSGLDSTYLMWKNLEDGNEVTPIYIEIKNNENKTKIEKQNVKMLCEKFGEKYTDKLRPLLSISEVLISNGNSDLIFSQLPIWIFSLLYIPIFRINEIQIGYVMNDDAVSYIDDIKKFYKAHAWLQKGAQPKLVFPLIKTSKWNMMNELPYEYREFVTSCENPRLLPYHMHVKGTNKKLQFYKPCGDCVPCKRIIKDELGYNSIYQKMINDHNEKFEIGRKLSFLKEYIPEKYSEMNHAIELCFSIKKEMPLLDSSYMEMSKDADASGS